MKHAVEWGENSVEHQVERLFSLHHETNVTGLKSFLRGKFTSLASIVSCAEEI